MTGSFHHVALHFVSLTARSVTHDLVNSSRSFYSDWAGEELMPTVLRSGPYRIYFYSHEPNEPPHVHVDRDSSTAKFWLDPLELAINLGFSALELGRIRRVLLSHQAALLKAWHDYFRTTTG